MKILSSTAGFHNGQSQFLYKEFSYSRVFFRDVLLSDFPLFIAIFVQNMILLSAIVMAVGILARIVDAFFRG